MKIYLLEWAKDLSVMDNVVFSSTPLSVQTEVEKYLLNKEYSYAILHEIKLGSIGQSEYTEIWRHTK